MEEELFTHIEFNKLKHRLLSIVEFIQKSDLASSQTIAEINKIGHSETDVYIGKLSVSEIFREVVETLRKYDALQFERYKEWLFSEGKDYKEISLSDSSKWTLRLGENPNKFIHIHPSREQKLVLRLNASTLKTAILFLTANHDKDNNLVEINKLRTEYLNLPPIKSLAIAKKLESTINFLRAKL